MSPIRDRIAATLMIILGIATIGAFANSALEFSSVAPDRVHVEAWRMLAFVVFAGLFTLLAFFPRRMPGLWELLLFHKAGVPIFLTCVVNASTVANASLTDAAMIAVDEGLAATTLICYVLTEGWRAWAPRQSQPSQH